MVRFPSHALGFRRKTPLLGIELTDRTQPRVDLRLPVVSATVSIQKLRCIRNLSTPSLPAAEFAGSWRPPENNRKLTGYGAHEEPLTSAVVTRASNQSYLLQEPVNGHYSKPSTIRICHVCANDAPRNFSPMRSTPRNTTRTNVGAEPDEALSSKVIQIELQAILQANSGSRTRHRCLTQPHRSLLPPIHATESVAQVGANFIRSVLRDGRRAAG